MSELINKIQLEHRIPEVIQHPKLYKGRGYGRQSWPQGWFDLNQRLDFFPFKADLNH